MKLKLLNDMMIYVKVVEQGSFTGAANALDISKSVVSKHVARLEKTLEAQLLKRSTRNLSMTDAGRALFERCMSISRDIEEAELAVSYTHQEPTGTLRISAPFSFGHLHLSAAISDFLELHPKLKVHIELGMPEIDMIAQGVDLAIRIGEQPDSTLIARRLSMRPMRVCASPDYLEKHGTPKHPNELAEHHCLLYQGSPTGNEWHFQHNDELIRIPIRARFSSNSSQALEKAAVSGLGIVMLPGYMMTQDIKNGRLISLLQEYCPATIGIFAVYPHTRHLAPKVRSFIDFLQDRFSEDEYWYNPDE